MTACTANNTKEQVSEQSRPEPVEFPTFNSKFSNQQTLDVTDKLDRTFDLDSTQYSNWTDKFVPYKTDMGRLYSAQLYSVQPQQEKYAVLTLKVNADDWFKLHLVTIDEELQLVDQIPISDSWSDLLEQAGDTEIVGKQSMYTNMISGNEYRRFDIRTTEIINYYTDSTTYEIDSIATKIELLNNGTFELTRLDSIRTIKYGGIE
ncbi:MAG: hypothetical protein RIG77_09720 [Cyclobacteriaceae bacterium]